MTADILAIRSGSDPRVAGLPSVNAFGDAVVLGDGERSVERQPAKSLATFARANGTWERLTRVDEIDAELTITTERMIVGSTKFDTGGGWVGLGAGGVLASGVANVVSKKRAEKRSQGLMLVGHVRYEWLVSIATRDRIDWTKPNRVRVLFAGLDGRFGMLELTLDAYTPASRIGWTIAGLAAAHQAARLPDGAARSALEAYAQGPVYIPDGTAGYLYELPSADG